MGGAWRGGRKARLLKLAFHHHLIPQGQSRRGEAATPYRSARWGGTKCRRGKACQTGDSGRGSGAGRPQAVATGGVTRSTYPMSAKNRHEIRESRRAILLGNLLGWFMRVGSWTLRFRIEDRGGIGTPGTHPGPVIYALWHNRFFTVPAAWRKICGKSRRSVVLTSASLDGTVVARSMAVFGLGAIRGSSSRRGVAALVGMKRALRDGFDVCITPDGPRGPRYVFHPGMVKLAAATGTAIIPIHVRFSAAWRLKTWDRFVIPKPFSRVHVIFDHPLTVIDTAEPAAFEAERQRIEDALVAGVDDR